MTDRVHVTVRFPPEVLATIDEMADLLAMSRNRLVLLLIERGFAAQNGVGADSKFASR